MGNEARVGDGDLGGDDVGWLIRYRAFIQQAGCPIGSHPPVGVVGVTFGEGAEGHVGLAYTEELFNLQDAACRAVARELSIIFC